MKIINIITILLFLYSLIGILFLGPTPWNFLIFGMLLYLFNCFLVDQFDDPIGKKILAIKHYKQS